MLIVYFPKKKKKQKNITIAIITGARKAAAQSEGKA